MLQQEIDQLTEQVNYINKGLKKTRFSNYLLYSLSLLLFVYYSFLLPKTSKEFLSKETGSNHIVALIDAQVPSNIEIIQRIEGELPKQSQKILDQVEEKLPEFQEALNKYIAQVLAPKLKRWTEDNPKLLESFIVQHPELLHDLEEAKARTLSRKFYESLEENRKEKFVELQKKFDEVFTELNAALKNPKTKKQKALRKLLIGLRHYYQSFKSSKK